MAKMNKIVALFVEGATEIEFYKAVINYIHGKMGIPYDCSFEWIDMRGIGRYKSDVLRKFNHLKQKNPKKDIYAILCIDTDVFEKFKEPRINKTEIQKNLQKAGAKEVHFIEAKSSIEDWFIADFRGVLSYLKLPLSTKKPLGSGQEVLKQLFKKANKVYVKGSKTEGFIQSLDISIILSTKCQSIKQLCTIINADCSKVC